MAQASPLVVMGMSGSGSVHVAKALQDLGVRFLSADDFLDLDSPQARSAIQTVSITSLNLRLLFAFQLQLESTGSLPEAWRSYPEAQSLRAKLLALLGTRFETGGVAGLHLSSASVLSPVYEDVFVELGVSPHYVVCVQEPPVEEPKLGAWLRQTLGALELARGGDFTVVLSSEFSRDPVSCLRRIVGAHPDLNPSEEQWASAVSSARQPVPLLNPGPVGEREYPDLVVRLLAALEQGTADFGSLIDEFNLWREMLAPPGNPGTQFGLAWFDKGVVQTAQVPFLPSGDWQSIRLAIDAPAGTLSSGLMYGRPCRVWIRRVTWSPGGEPARLVSGPGSHLQEVGDGWRLDGAYESSQISVRTPLREGPYQLELEFLLEAGLQITVSTAQRLAGRIHQCVARHASLLSEPGPKGPSSQ
jgi:hypothetical protein